MTVVGRWLSSGVGEERRGSRRVFDMSKNCNVLTASYSGGIGIGTQTGAQWTMETQQAHHPPPPRTFPKHPHTVHIPFLLRSACVHWRSLTVLLRGLYMDRGRADKSPQVARTVEELQENVVGRSKSVDSAVYVQYKDDRRTVDGRNQVSGWEAFRNFLKRLSTEINAQN